MNVSVTAVDAYNYIVNLSGVGVFIVWGIISLTHLRFRKAWKLQGHTRDELPYKAKLFPVFPIVSIIANIFLGLVQGWSYFKPFDAKNFVDAYILIPAGIILYLGVSYWKTKGFLTAVDLSEVNLLFGQRLPTISQDMPSSTDSTTSVVITKTPRKINWKDILT